MLQTAAEHGAGPAFLGQLRDMGSHLASLRALRRGAIDAAAIDSTVLALRWRRDPALRTALRVVAGLGPWPIQPMVMRRSLPARLKAALTSAIGALAETPERRRALRRWLVSGVAPMTDADFDVERTALARAQALEHALHTPPAAARAARPVVTPRFLAGPRERVARNGFTAGLRGRPGPTGPRSHPPRAAAA